MNLLILIGFKSKSPNVPVGLYIGTDGEALETAASEAAGTGEFVTISKISNPTRIPMPVVDSPTTTTKPTFVRPKVTKTEVKKPNNALDKHQKQVGDLREKQRLETLAAMTGKTTAKPGSEKPSNPVAQNPSTAPAPVVPQNALRQDGPTFEEFVAGGGAENNYPPTGFAAKDTEMWRLYQDVSKPAAPAQTGEAAKPGSETKSPSQESQKPNEIK